MPTPATYASVYRISCLHQHIPCAGVVDTCVCVCVYMCAYMCACSWMCVRVLWRACRSYQICVDIGYYDRQLYDECEHFVVGPGAVNGLWWLFGDGVCGSSAAVARRRKQL